MLHGTSSSSSYHYYLWYWRYSFLFWRAKLHLLRKIFTHLYSGTWKIQNVEKVQICLIVLDKIFQLRFSEWLSCTAAEWRAGKVPHQTACAALAAAPDDTNPYSTSKLAASQGNAAASTSFTADPALHFWNSPGILTSSFIARESKHNLLFHKTRSVNHKIIMYSN